MRQNNGDGSGEARGMAAGTGVDEKKTRRRKGDECAAGGTSWDLASAVREAEVTHQFARNEMELATDGTSIARLAYMNGIPVLRLPAERTTTAAAIGLASLLDVGLPRTKAEAGDATLLDEKNGATDEAERSKPSPTHGRREKDENATWTRSLPRWTPKSSGRSTRIGQSGES